jgi:hypothetical protein
MCWNKRELGNVAVICHDYDDDDGDTAALVSVSLPVGDDEDEVVVEDIGTLSVDDDDVAGVVVVVSLLATSNK